MADIRIIPNRTSGDPYMVFSPSGTASSGINLYVLTSATGLSDTGVATLSFEGSQGQLFSVTDQLQSGVIFSVNDIGGLPLIEADASGYVYLARYGESVGVGQYINSGVRLLVSPGLTSRVGLAITGVAGQTADLFQVRNASGNMLFEVSSSGNVGIATDSPEYGLDIYKDVMIRPTGSRSYYLYLFDTNNYIYRDTTSSINVRANDSFSVSPGGGSNALFVGQQYTEIASKNSAYRALVVKGSAAQAANLIEIQNSSGTNLITVSNNGDLRLRNSLYFADTTGGESLYINNISANNNGRLVVNAVSDFNLTHDGRYMTFAPKLGVIAAPDIGQIGFQAGYGMLTHPYTMDVYLSRDAANTLAQRNGANPQTFNLYNVYTDTGNYERGRISWENNVFRIIAEKAGTGTARSMLLQTSDQNIAEIALTAGAGYVIIARNSRVHDDATGATITASNSGPGMSLTSDLTIAGKSRTSGSGGSSNLRILAGDTNHVSYPAGNILIRAGVHTASGGINGNILIDELPRIDPLISGAIWNNGNIISVSTSGIPLTISNPFRLIQTWNNSGVGFTGLLMNITDSGSLSNSILLDLQVNSISKFSVDKYGTITSASGVRYPDGVTQTIAYTGQGSTAISNETSIINALIFG